MDCKNEEEKQLRNRLRYAMRHGRILIFWQKGVGMKNYE